MSGVKDEGPDRHPASQLRRDGDGDWVQYFDRIRAVLDEVPFDPFEQMQAIIDEAVAAREEEPDRVFLALIDATPGWEPPAELSERCGCLGCAEEET